jgi:hypothetical protein
MQVEATNQTVDVTNEDTTIQEVNNSKEDIISPVTSQVDLKSSTVEAWNQQLNQDLNTTNARNIRNKKKRKTE